VSIERREGESYFAAASVVRRFLSVLAWKWRVPFREMGQTGGTHRIRVGGRVDMPLRIYPSLDFSKLFVPATSEQERALALYREALGLEPNQTYKFLALFRIFNVTLAGPQEQINWIDHQLQDVSYPASDRILVLQKEMGSRYKSVGDYLYAAGRSALAHSSRPPLIDPDEFNDTYRINLDLPVIEQLLRLYMERELGLPPQ